MRCKDFVLFLVALLLTACSPIGAMPVPTATGTPPPADPNHSGQFTSIPPTTTPTSSPHSPLLWTPMATSMQCLSVFEHRELKEPYQRDKHTNEPRYTLSAEEWNAYLSTMGIQSLCIPASWGAPFVNADWDGAVDPSWAEGRMISLGFEDLYPGAGWSKGFLLYSTYEFRAATEYETFATPADRETVRDGAAPNLIEMNGVRGLLRMKRADLCMGKCGIYRTFVFPFETYYVAVVYELGAFDYEADWEAIFQDFQAGKYPPEQWTEVAAMDYLVSSLRFQPSIDQ